MGIKDGERERREGRQRRWEEFFKNKSYIKKQKWRFCTWEGAQELGEQEGAIVSHTCSTARDGHDCYVLQTPTRKNEELFFGMCVWEANVDWRKKDRSRRSPENLNFQVWSKVLLLLLWNLLHVKTRNGFYRVFVYWFVCSSYWQWKLGPLHWASSATFFTFSFWDTVLLSVWVV